MSGVGTHGHGWQPLGDSALLWRGSFSGARAWYQQLRENPLPHVTDVVLAFGAVALHLSPSDGPAVLAALAAMPPPPEATPQSAGRCVVIPVQYGGEAGPDLESCASSLGRSCDEVISLHSGATYHVAAIGFSPGFPYLVGLPETLHLPRKSTPAPVAAGTVAIAGQQAGIYPNDSPGGWHRLGQTQVELFDATREHPALLQPGDEVRFRPVTAMPRRTPAPPAASPPRCGVVEVVVPGACTTVQDLGRVGFRHVGVGTSGVADPRAAKILNQLVGNPSHAAVLECAASGPVLTFHQPATVAWFGWRNASGKPIRIDAGEHLDLASVPLHSARGVIAISGGIATPLVLGSRSTDLRAKVGGLAGRALVVGDQLPIGPAGSAQASPHHAPPWYVPWRSGRFHWGSHPQTRSEDSLVIRFLPGIDWDDFPAASRERWCSDVFHLSGRTNRTAAQLNGPRLATTQEQSLQPSQPVVAGSVQVPPDGLPLVLLTECQTIGGYPQIAHVISADLPILTTSMPGTRVRFIPVSLSEAQQAWQTLNAESARLQHSLNAKLDQM